MATSGPITYLVMEDQFLSVAATQARPQTTAMPSPLIRIRVTALPQGEWS
jgi:hypothetical protein